METLTTITHSDPIAESQYTALEKELMLFAAVKSEQDGIIGKPGKESEFKLLFFNKIESKIQSELDKNQATHLPLSGMVVAKKIMADAEEAARPLSGKLRDMEYELRTLEENKKRFFFDKTKRMIKRLVYLGIAIISVGEGYFAYDALRHIPLPKIPALIASVGITIGLGVSTHIMAGYILRSKTTGQYLKRFFLCTVPVFIGFAALGKLRAAGYATSRLSLEVTQFTPPDQGNWSMWITILSILLWLSALLFSMRYRITPEEENQEAQYNRACNELAECKEQMGSLRSNIHTILHDAHEKSAGALRTFERAIGTEHRLQTLAKQVTEEYISKNLNYRKDTVIPPFFSEPPAFHFRLFFDNVKKQKS